MRLDISFSKLTLSHPPSISFSSDGTFSYYCYTIFLPKFNVDFFLGPKQQKPKSGKFEMPIEETDFALDNDIEEYNFNELLSPLLLKAAADDALEEGEIFN